MALYYFLIYEILFTDKMTAVLHGIADVWSPNYLVCDNNKIPSKNREMDLQKTFFEKVMLPHL